MVGKAATSIAFAALTVASFFFSAVLSDDGGVVDIGLDSAR